MSFDVSAESYDRFMGRFSQPLAPVFADFARVHSGTALDVGAGPGALTGALLARSVTVTAVEPADGFRAALQARFPAAEVVRGTAEELPFGDDRFDATLAQLVVHFMRDPAAGVTEMARVTRPGGTVATCVWDHAGGSGPLAPFWGAVRSLDPSVAGEAELPGAREGQLGELLEAAGLDDVDESGLGVTVRFASFDDWWAPYLLGVGPSGAYVARLGERDRERLRERCAERLARAPFELGAVAWAARGTVP